MPKRDLGDLARLLAEKADGDERALAKLRGEEEVPDEVLGFHAQQAVEKLFKAVLAHAGVAPPRSHDLAYLVGLMEDNGISPPPDQDAVRALTPWAAEFRYENAFGHSLERDRAVELVEKVREWADRILASAR